MVTAKNQLNDKNILSVEDMVLAVDNLNFEKTRQHAENGKYDNIEHCYLSI